MFKVLLPAVTLLLGAQAATKDQWRSRSIYQVLTDRFSSPTDGQKCDISSYCGGTWRTLIDRLDYIQGLNFNAVWISPASLGLQGSTPWGENYHNYWTVDPFGIHPQFGTADDLKALSAALHERGMYLMVDFAVNHLASLGQDISDSALASQSDGRLLFKQEKYFHPQCDIDYNSEISVQQCWLATEGVALMDLRTEDAAVSDVLTAGIAAYVKEYGIDGLRIDAAKHMTKKFVYDFCTAADVFCIAEILTEDTYTPAQYTIGDYPIDSVFGFGMKTGALEVFTKDMPMSRLSFHAGEADYYYADATLVGAILDNHDLPRFGTQTSDKSKIYNAIALQFLWGGIPSCYYGLEQDISTGTADPYNRPALWEFGNYQTTGTTYQRIAKMNLIRTKLGELGGFLETTGKVVLAVDDSIAFDRNGALLILTNRGAGQSGDWTIANSSFSAGASVVDLLSCSTATAGADSSLTVSFVDGYPFFYVAADIADQIGICSSGTAVLIAVPSSSTASSSSASAAVSTSTAPSSSSSTAAVPSSSTISTPVQSVQSALPTSSPVVESSMIDQVPASSTDSCSCNPTRTRRSGHRGRPTSTSV